MSSYIIWLKSQDAEDCSECQDLINIYESNHQRWDNSKDDIYELRLLVNELSPSLIGVLDSTWIDWKQNKTTCSWEEKLKSKFNADTFAKSLLFVSVVGVSVTLLMIMYRIFVLDSELLVLLSTTNNARGLITFLFAFGTIIISLILVLTTVFSRPGNESEFKYRKERFTQAKEVLALLLGILGTIVGFYFGTASNQPRLEKLEISEVVFNKPPIVGDKLTILVKVRGGAQPYDYKILFSNNEIESVNGKSVSGFISYSLLLPSTLEQGNIESNVSFFVFDKNGHSVSRIKPLFEAVN